MVKTPPPFPNNLFRAMADLLATLRGLVRCPADAVRWACVLEATAPKAGNVYPGKPFEDLTYRDFIVAADIAAESLGESGRRYSERIAGAVQQTVRATGTNVNLGIVLLLGPIVAADELVEKQTDTEFGLRPGQWSGAIGDVLDRSDEMDAKNIFAAIAGSSAGGLGRPQQMDVTGPMGHPPDLLRAMRYAQSYDRIARQYATGFDDLIQNVVPVLRQSLTESGDLLTGIARAHLRLLALEPDSLIARKNGQPVADQVQSHAQQVDLDDPGSVADFDDFLRSAGHPLNPGTTADLIAAGLYCLLRTFPE